LVQGGGEWTDPELDKEQFAALFGRWTPHSGSRHGN